MRRFDLQPSQYRDLGRIEMSCDRPLTQRKIKEPFMNKSHAMAITGPPGSGKTSFALSLLQKPKRKDDQIYYKTFRNILWVCPESSRQSIKSCALHDLDRQDVFDDFNSDVHDKIHDNRKDYGDRPYSQLLILDDCSSLLKESVDILNGLFMNRRHLNLSIIVMAQYTVSIPRSIRAQLSMVVLFKPSAQDYTTIHKEYLPDLSKQEFAHLAKFVWKSLHDHLIVNRESNVLYKNLQKIEMS